MTVKTTTLEASGPVHLLLNLINLWRQGNDVLQGDIIAHPLEQLGVPAQQRRPLRHRARLEADKSTMGPIASFMTSTASGRRAPLETPGIAAATCRSATAKAACSALRFLMWCFPSRMRVMASPSSQPNSWAMHFAQQ